MEQKISAFMNELDLGSLEGGYQDESGLQVLATPAAVATCWYVAGGVAGAGAVVGAYVAGRNEG
ncbi:hypothetical protein ABZY20_16725 [Streptomyces sp. NPDC006624]|uniref:hypothetical protein n=1 Tax=unclassified Streptomyces TaxID=2593676 RepID=UPI0033ADD9FA